MSKVSYEPNNTKNRHLGAKLEPIENWKFPKIRFHTPNHTVYKISDAAAVGGELDGNDGISGQNIGKLTTGVQNCWEISLISAKILMKTQIWSF